MSFKVVTASLLLTLFIAAPVQAAPDFSQAPVIGSVIRWLGARERRMARAAKVTECKAAAAKRGVTEHLDAETITALKSACK